jgi:hypothetical protein
MANTKIKGNEVGLYFNNGTTAVPDWVLFACSTSDGFSGSTENVTLASKCDGGWVDSLPTNLSWEFTNSAYAITDPSATQASHVKAFDLWSNKTEGQFKLANGDDSYLRIGQGYVSSYSETAANEDALQFELTITGKGAIANVVPV